VKRCGGRYRSHPHAAHSPAAARDCGSFRNADCRNVTHPFPAYTPARAVTITKGQTVRFTNNSSHLLWIASIGDAQRPLYPKVQNGCGSSRLDSCIPIASQDFWEFSFTQEGTWRYAGNLDKTRTGTVVVQYNDERAPTSSENDTLSARLLPAPQDRRGLFLSTRYNRSRLTPSQVGSTHSFPEKNKRGDVAQLLYSRNGA